MATFQCLCKVLLSNYWTALGVYQQDSTFHIGDVLDIYQPCSILRQGAMQAYHIGFAQQLFQFNILQRIGFPYASNARFMPNAWAIFAAAYSILPSPTMPMVFTYQFNTWIIPETEFLGRMPMAFFDSLKVRSYMVARLQQSCKNLRYGYWSQRFLVRLLQRHQPHDIHTHRQSQSSLCISHSNLQEETPQLKVPCP